MWSFSKRFIHNHLEVGIRTRGFVALLIISDFIALYNFTVFSPLIKYFIV